jgi:hypothetical protein
MTKKHLGICPFCKELTTPSVAEDNTLRRDKCICPKCSNVVYVCRTPGCDDYTRGGDIYDDELCPACTASVVDCGTVAIKAAAYTAGAAIGAVAVAAASEKFR